MPSATSKLPSLAGASWLSAAPVQRVLAVIEAGGFQARVVGGCVRNALLAKPITDIDIATTALAPDVMRLARAAGLAVVETGIDHGTVTVVVDRQAFEVTTLRRDVATDGRRATVAFSTDWTEDARRRDFTLNALYADAKGRVFDPLGGYSDLCARRVRFIGEATERIREDYLRILRFFRFSAQYGSGPLDADGLRACTRERDGLARLSAERIRQELVRLLVAARAVDHLVAMQEHAILACVLPLAPRPGLLTRLVEIERTCDLPPDAMTRLAALAVETFEDVACLSSRLRLSRDESAALAETLSSAARLASPADDASARGLLYRLKEAAYRRALMIAWSRALDISTDDPAWVAAVTLPLRWTPPRLSVSGADVLMRGLAPGPRVGELLAAVEDWWIANGFTPDRDAQLAYLDQLLAR